MFVSSYNTYISTNNSDKTIKTKSDRTKLFSNSFDNKLLQNTIIEEKETKNLPINYISNYKAFSNKQKLQDGFENSQKAKYDRSYAINNATIAYTENSKIFSYVMEPKTTQNQTLNIDKSQEQLMRKLMINTYQENDKYYQIGVA